MYPRFLKVRASAYSSRLNLLFFFHPPSTHIKGRRITQAHHESPSTLYPNRYPNGADTVRYWLTFRSAKRLVFRTAWYFLILGGMYTIEFKSRHLDCESSCCRLVSGAFIYLYLCIQKSPALCRALIFCVLFCHKLNFYTHIHTGCQSLQQFQGWVVGAVFNAGYVGLGDACLF